jgi:hypothetical protein
MLLLPLLLLLLLLLIIFNDILVELVLLATFGKEYPL